ncbi:MAG: hypothetical protein R3247_12080, partial [Rhodothermales bacterium]|nr:hypothetical protein [Rhodothermales bacterium]
MPTLDRIELRDSTRQAVVLPDLVGLLEAVEVDERLLEEGEVRLVLLSGTDAQAADTLQPGQVVRAVYAPGSVPLVEEWRLYGAEREYGERASTEARARPLWWDLAGRAATKTLPGTGAVRGAWTIYRRAPAAALSEIMAAAAPTFLAGTTSGLSAEQAAARVSLQVAGHTVLEALRMLCENLACEWSLRYESAEDQYYIDLVEEVQAAGAASSRPLRASAAAISNRLRLTRRTDTGEYWSRLYARLEGEGAASGAVGGGSAGGSVGLGEASFEVEAASGSAPSVTLALPAGVVPYDGWGTAGGGREQVFAGTDSAGFFQITASEAAPAGGGSPGSSTVTLGGGAFAAGDRIRFATDAAGTWLTFIEIESPQYGRVDRVEAIPGSP